MYLVTYLKFYVMSICCDTGKPVPKIQVPQRLLGVSALFGQSGDFEQSRVAGDASIGFNGGFNGKTV